MAMDTCAWASDKRMKQVAMLFEIQAMGCEMRNKILSIFTQLPNLK
jgi:hypothetical protein